MRALPVLISAAALAVTIAAPAALASAPGQGSWGRPGGHSSHGPQAMQHRLDRYLDRLRNDLHLKKGQEDAWQDFAQTLKARAASAAKHWQEARRKRPKTAPERLDQGIRFTQQRLQSLQALEKAVKPLYARLSPVQRSVFDLEFRRHGGFHHGHGRRW
ncbi:MAG TPA: Spy/CpxP family protein refolding chaperone [Gammaproteobacteria bacterium]|nr:Spy/CpxP family protein refolding chaperone [Gammaproteobacteria bacterium]